ncbi:MAG TPA: helix-turn-helix transcriptional regulator [Candidatus Enterocloster excrementigallinarum]|uniref:Helix-turn-helix transcriptional regulator n=1 Tax=Candidatus Enterocloster excrementigallinarum TaxID=2838558 RepID=A0A9D2PSK9_9FIRM|nr:helix-turn-helix transcriptional regulator [Candidatus Enterocloster excrementigallinarum]
MIMEINKLLQEKGLTKYRLSVLSGVPHATLSDLCNGKTSIGKCSVETIYKLAKALGVSMETLVEDAFKPKPSGEELREKSYEYGLPEYLQRDLDAFKEGLKNGSSLIDCLWGELYGSINMAEISDGVITPEHADYLRQKYLWGGGKADGAH